MPVRQLSSGNNLLGKLEIAKKLIAKGQNQQALEQVDLLIQNGDKTEIAQYGISIADLYNIMGVQNFCCQLKYDVS